ncbi:MAG: FAD-dependent thymidylate synthase [Desulfurococcales archaeon]|nr:FAD-dependent thymidylate synthase [Desulfurococcales archaeon]
MDKIRVSLLAYTEDGERLIAAASKTSLSRKSPEKILSMPDEEVEEWIRETWRRQHFSPWEHSVYTWLADGCSRVCSHQLVRHRLASYTQQSMRYTEGSLREAALEAAGLLGIECPRKPREAGARRAYECYSMALREAVRSGLDPVRLAKPAFVFPPSLRGEALVEAANLYLEAAARYYSLLAVGVSREDARFLIPHAVRTRIVVTMNARELVQSFLPLRMCTRAQWEIRLVAWKLWKRLVEVHPRLFKWAGPRCVFQQNTTSDPRPLVDYLEGRASFTIPRCPELVPREGIRACLLHANGRAGRV